MTEKEAEILAIKDIAGLRRLDPESFFYALHLTDQSVRHILELCGCFWMHSGNPKDPHAELTSGKCSNGFIDVFRALSYTNLCQIFAYQLLCIFDENFPDVDVEWVIGSSYAATDLAKDVANANGSRHGIMEKGEDKTQLWQRLAINEGEVVLQVEELITTLGTTEAVRSGLRDGNPHPVTFAPTALCLVHRSNATEIEGDPLLYLSHFDIWTADQSECELCKQGSRRVRPKTHWAELTGVG
jgi:hypothetical protein